MGVDWIPCKIEPRYSREEIEAAVRCEAIFFRMHSFASSLIPPLSFSDAERAEIEKARQELGDYYDRFLFKQTSHRTSVVTCEELFPIEWRMDAERTILPWELESELQKWQRYRTEVAEGRHAGYLRQLYVYERLREFNQFDLANLLCAVNATLGKTAAWAKRPEMMNCRDEILKRNLLDVPPWPRWPDGGGVSDVSLVLQAYQRVDAIICRWNEAVQRGNMRSTRPKKPLGFEDWVASRLNDQWFPRFLEWVEPWRRGEYGLFRDCA
jgi:hypothetical protein